MMPASIVSAPTFVARTRSMPVCVDRRADDRVACALSRPACSRPSASTRPRPRRRRARSPSVGIFSPGRTTNSSPTRTCSSGRSSSRPSRTTWATRGAQPRQTPDRLAGLPLGARLQVLAEVDQRDDQRGGVVEGRAHPTTCGPERRHDAHQEGRRRAEADQHVHVRAEVAQHPPGRCGGSPSRRSPRPARSAPAAASSRRGRRS